LNNFERYRAPVSHANVTTRFGAVCSRQKRMAAASSVPVDEPASTPSFCSSSRATENDSASGMLYARFVNEKSQIDGMKSSPMPSTSHEPFCVIVPDAMYSARIEPCGSASTSSTWGACFLKYAASPAIVPLDPTPTTTASSL